MRITQNMIHRNYMQSINSNLENLSRAQQRISSGRRFTRISENVADGMRSLQMRRLLAENRQQQLNARDAKGIISSAESELKNVNDALLTAIEKAKRAWTDTSKSTHSITAEEIDGIRNEIIQFMNSQYAGHFLFGGTNNESGPFQLDAAGKLTYNGVDVDSVVRVGDNQYVSATPPGNPVTIPQNESVYMDLGMGMVVNNGVIDPRTGLEISFSGLEIMGCGRETLMTSDGGVLGVDSSNNIINLLGEISSMLKGNPPYDATQMGALVDKLSNRREDFFLSVTEIGNRDNFLDQTLTRLESEADNMTDARGRLEGVNDYEESMKVSLFMYCWNATLKMGGKILPQSLMDFIN